MFYIKRNDGSCVWPPFDKYGKESIWTTYKREQSFRNAIRNVKPIEFMKKKSKDTAINDSM